MKNNKSKNRKVDWGKILPEMQKEMDSNELKSFLENQQNIDEKDLKKIKSLYRKISSSVMKETAQKVREYKSQPFKPVKKIKEIILNLEVLPFEFATRTNDVLEVGKPWRHDGSEIKFKLQIPHDKLELYSPKGEFLQSFPVSFSGEVKVENLDAGVYYLYLRGRKIVGMQFEGK